MAAPPAVPSAVLVAVRAREVDPQPMSIKAVVVAIKRQATRFKVVLHMNFDAPPASAGFIAEHDSASRSRYGARTLIPVFSDPNRLLISRSSITSW